MKVEESLEVEISYRIHFCKSWSRPFRDLDFTHHFRHLLVTVYQSSNCLELIRLF